MTKSTLNFYSSQQICHLALEIGSALAVGQREVDDAKSTWLLWLAIETHC